MAILNTIPIVKFKLLSYWISVATSIQCSQIFGRHCLMVFIMTKYIDSDSVEIMNTCKRWMFLRSSKAFQEIHGIKWPQHLFSTTFLHLFVCQLLLFVCLLMINIYKIFQIDVYMIYKDIPANLHRIKSPGLLLLARHFCVCLFVNCICLFVDDQHVQLDVFTIHKSIPANLHRHKRPLSHWHTTVCKFYHVPYEHATI